MKKIFFYLKEIIQNINLSLILKLNLVILKKNYSKYPDYLEKFESSLAKKFGFKYCLSFSSGTAAFYASLISLNLKKKSKVLVTSLTFPTIIEILKKKDFDIYYIDIDRNFDFIQKDIIVENYDLCVLTHPYGFYFNLNNLKKILQENTKIIFDSSHSQGIEIEGINHMKFADLSFMSLQGNKAISGGEGGVIFTDNRDLYLRMILNHHPGHKKNPKFKVVGAIDDLKLRMHPLAAILAENDMKSFEKRNNELKNKIVHIYNNLDELKITHPYNENSKIGGFHFGIPFFFRGNLSSKIIKRYNWYENLESLNIKSISNNEDISFFKDLYFIDLKWIKNNNLSKIKNEIKKIFTNVS